MTSPADTPAPVAPARVATAARGLAAGPLLGGGLAFWVRAFGALLLIALPGLGAGVAGVALAVYAANHDAGVGVVVGLLVIALSLYAGWLAGGAAHAVGDLEQIGRIRISRALGAILARPVSLAVAGALFVLSAVAIVVLLGVTLARVAEADLAGPNLALPAWAVALLGAPLLLGMVFARFGAVFAALDEDLPLVRALGLARALSRGRRGGPTLAFALLTFLMMLLAPMLSAFGFAMISDAVAPLSSMLEPLLITALIAGPVAIAAMALAALTAVYGRRLLAERHAASAETVAQIFE